MPPNELQHKLRALRGHLRRLILLAGASRVVLVVAAVLAASLMLDWMVKLETPGRAVLLAAAGVLTLYALWRFLVVPLRVRLGDEELAIALERRFPELQDRLISTVQFARAPDTGPLSQAMVAQLQRDTLSQTQPLEFQAVATARPTAAWAVGAALTLVVASLYTLWFPTTAAIFAARFFDPFSAIEWPRHTQLTVLAHDKDNHPLALDGDRIFVPKGEDLHLTVRAARHSGKLWHPPSRVSVRYRFDAGGSGRRNVPMSSHATYITAFPTVTESFVFDVAGGDDTTRPLRVQVRNRPRIEDIRVTLRAPDYAGEPEHVQPDGRGGIVGLAGSVATIAVTTNKSIAAAPGSARILVDGKPVADMAFAGDQPTRLTGSFRLETGHKQYAVALVDTLGLANSPPTSYRLDVRPDRAPVVQLPQPGGSRKVTPKAVVPLRVVAKDDYGVRRVRFVSQRGDQGKPTTHTLPDPKTSEKTVERSHEWDLTELALKQREMLLVHAEAEDAFAASRDGKPVGPNVGKSPTYQLSVISEAEMAALLQRRQQEIKERLKKLIARQQTSKDDVERLGSPTTTPDRRKVKLAEREQTKIAAATTTLGKQLKDVLGEMKNNKVGNLEERRRADALAKALAQLATRDMPQAAKHIATAAQATKRPDQLKHLASAAAKQQQVIDDLRAALARFDQWQDIDELIRDASQLLLDQTKLKDKTADLGRKLLGKPADKLTPEEKGAARSLARAQRGARDRMQALETKMAAVGRRLQGTDPAAAKIVEQAMSQATADQIRPRMDDAAGRIDQARPASALPHQAKAAEAMKRLVDTLSRARSPYRARDIRELQKRLRDQMKAVDELLRRERSHRLETALANMRRQLARLRKQQANTHAATGKATSPKDLQQQAPPQTDHGRDATALGSKLDKLAATAPKAAKDALAKASKNLQGASQQMTKAAGSLSKASAAKAQQQAMKKLDEASRQLAGLQKALAQNKAEPTRLPERAQEQNKTAKDTQQATKNIQKAAQDAKKSFPTTAKSIQQAGRNTQQASSAMTQAKKALDQASQQPKASASQQQNAEQQQQQAVDDLKRAREQLAKAHDQLDMRRRVQKLFELRKALTEMLPRQVAIRAATQKLDAASEGGRKPFDHAQTLALRGLADKQGKLHTDAGKIIKALEGEQVVIFLYVMRDTAELMTQVQKRLTATQTDWLTQEAEHDIEQNIKELLEALKTEADRLAKKEKQQQQGGGGGGGGRPQPLVAPYHQLKQLRNLQTRVNEQTRAMEIEKTARRRLSKRLREIRSRRLSKKQRDIGGLSREFGDALQKQREQESMTPQ